MTRSRKPARLLKAAKGTKPASTVGDLFHRIAVRASRTAGSLTAFGAAVFAIVVWSATGPLFGFSDSWQLVINTGTTIVTFLMVFLIENTQNRDTEAIHAKLDELIRATRGARNDLVAAEDLNDEDLAALKDEFKELADVAITRRRDRRFIARTGHVKE
jgi:low affinity Fe/Cu permease